MQTNVNGASVLGEVGLSGDLHLLQHLLPLSSECGSRPIIQRIIRKPVGTTQLDIVSAKGKEMSVRERSMAQFIPPKLKSSLWASMRSLCSFPQGFCDCEAPTTQKSVPTHYIRDS